MRWVTVPVEPPDRAHRRRVHSSDSSQRFRGRRPAGYRAAMPLPDDARRALDHHALPGQGGPGQKHLLVEEAKKVVERVALLDTERVGEDVFAELHRGHRPPGRASWTARRRCGSGAACQPRAATTASSPSAPASAAAATRWPRRSSSHGGRGHPRATPTWGAAYEGPQDCVHGGFVAAAFDDLLGCAQMASGIAGFTGTLTVKMVKPTPLYRRIDYAAGVDRIEGRKIFCWGTAHDGDKLLAEAQCVFIAPACGMASRPPE